ncbi:photosystem II reaction center W protein, chloroplastic-like isoform X1 [Punica granatum]|uniref:PSII 6.1 kDa protein n=2 Tax=Punica granatum TaxID=22663 RepID=A0A6P8C068_PUNGR|nr:photosystem II reaction center W protein, chloroplastic-like isoform X1 [Punica granatum]
MASVTATAVPTSIVTRSAGLSLRRLSGVTSSPVLVITRTRTRTSSSWAGLPAVVMKGRVRCSMDGKASPAGTSTMGMSASLIAAISAAMLSGPAMALVDERMSTEGTGLPFGLSNNVLGWILFGVFGLIWALYFTYTSGLDEDEESGLSL